MEAVALMHSDPSQPYPDIEFQFCPLVIDHAEGGAKGGTHGCSNSCGPVAVEGTGFHVKSHAGIHDYIMEHVAGDYHPVGTCKIGTDESQNATPCSRCVQCYQKSFDICPHRPFICLFKARYTKKVFLKSGGIWCCDCFAEHGFSI